MNGSQVNKLLVALVVLLLSAVVALGWKIWHQPRYAIPVSPPEVPVHLRDADRQEIEKAFQKLHDSLEKYAFAQVERDRRLEERIAAAAKANDPALEQRLQSALEQKRRQWDEYQERFRAWEKRIQEPPETPEPQEPAVEPPPSPPSFEDDSEEETAPSGDDGFGALAELVGAGVCIAQPELCPVVLAFVEILKGLSLGEREEALRLGEAIALGQGAPPDVVDAAGKLLRNPEARQAIEDLIDRRAELGLPESPELRETLEVLGLSPPLPVTGLVREVEALLAEERYEEVCPLIKQRWGRVTAPEASELYAFMDRHPEWSSHLAPCLPSRSEERP